MPITRKRASSTSPHLPSRRLFFQAFDSARHDFSGLSPPRHGFRHAPMILFDAAMQPLYDSHARRLIIFRCTSSTARYAMLISASLLLALGLRPAAAATFMRFSHHDVDFGAQLYFKMMTLLFDFASMISLSPRHSLYARFHYFSSPFSLLIFGIREVT